MPKRGWCAMNDGSWHLTLKAICKEFKMTEEQVVQFLNSSHGRAVENFSILPSSWVKLVGEPIGQKGLTKR